MKTGRASREFPSSRTESDDSEPKSQDTGPADSNEDSGRATERVVPQGAT